MVCMGPTIGEFQGFAARMRAEFVEGSAIAADVYDLATRLLEDAGGGPGGEAVYPIHEALNWRRVVRFGRQARAPLAAIALENGDGTVWQLKLSTPRQAGGKVCKYETPKGHGARGFFPAVPLRIWGAIAARAGLTVPAGATPRDFWPWVVAHPAVEVVVTEGGKKALALLSRGHCAIALYGVHGGHRRRDALGMPLATGPVLIDDLRPFATAGRSIQLAFDQDTHPTARSRVAAAIAALGGLLAAQGCGVKVLTWPAELGKGIDDVIAALGRNGSGGGDQGQEQALDAALGQIFAEALDLEAWQCWRQLQGRLTYRADWLIPGGDLDDQDWGGLGEAIARSQRPILAVASPKGTGKTKCLARWLAARGTTALVGHRVALMRNLCDRVGATYRGDLDRCGVTEGAIAGGAYSLRLGLCVDSLLALDPEAFRGCTLVLDEVVQVLRHLLLSATCRDRRAAILARFQTLVRGAALVLVADADLDDSSLNYLRQLRSEPGIEAQVLLVRNVGTPLGYGGEFLIAPNDQAAIARLLTAVAAGEKIFVATDSKRSSQKLKRLLEQLERLGVSVLVINADTSSGLVEQQFTRSPDAVLAALAPQVVIATPSLATGVSVEAAYFDRVFGLFYGVSITDGDMTQALGRVRQTVPRTVWCAERGIAPQEAARGQSAAQIRTDLKRRTDATAALLQQQLMAVGLGDLGDRVAWDDSPHVKLWSETLAARRFAMDHLRTALLVRLRYEGNTLQVVDCRDEADLALRQLIRQARTAVKHGEAEAIAQAPLPTPEDLRQWAQSGRLTQGQRWAIAKYDLMTFYGVDPAAITADFVLADRQGQQRQEIQALEAVLDPAIARDHDFKTVTAQASTEGPLTPWDFGQATLGARVRRNLQLEGFLDPDREWTKHDLAPLVALVRRHRRDVKLALGLDPSPHLHDVDIWHRLLRQLGLRCQFRWERRRGEKLRVYRLDRDRWQQLQSILEHRRQEHQRPADRGSPPAGQDHNTIYPGGDPPGSPPTLTECRTPAIAPTPSEIASRAPGAIAGHGPSHCPPEAVGAGYGHRLPSPPDGYRAEWRNPQGQ